MTDNNVHFSSERDDWATPTKLVTHMDEHYRARLGYTIALDVCATPANHKAPWYINPADEDALTTDWVYLLRGIEDSVLDTTPPPRPTPMAWMNPPYGRGIGNWVRKAYETGLQGYPVLALLPSRTDTRWWHDYVLKAYDVWDFDGRLYFDGHDNAAPFPSAMALFLGDLAVPVRHTIDARQFKRRKPIEFGLRKIRVRGHENKKNKHRPTPV